MRDAAPVEQKDSPAVSMQRKTKRFNGRGGSATLGTKAGGGNNVNTRAIGSNPIGPSKSKRKSKRK